MGKIKQASLWSFVDTLQVAKKELMATLKEGSDCPCCGQYARMYKRKLNSIMAIGLINLTKEYKKTNKFVHVHDIRLGDRDVRAMGGQFAGLKFWGLIEEQINEDTQKRCSGMWRPTKKGIDFVYKKIKVPEFIWVFNNKEYERAQTETVDIKDSLGTKFNYEDLMRNI